MPIRQLVPLLTLGVMTLGLFPQGLEAQPAPPEQEVAVHQQIERLRQAIAGVSPKSPAAEWLPDAAIYLKAAEWIVRHNEFYKPDYAEQTLAALQTGTQRTAALAADDDLARPPWLDQPGTVIQGYRSKVDDSLQPYALTLPAGFEPDPYRRWPLHVKLHGRGGTLNEVSFIDTHDGKPAPDGQDWIQLDVFGRTNNAYRWAGETDVFEAIDDVKRRYPIDERRITLWGFSMGGAGAWHLGLHHPSVWSSVGAGAGFADFYEYQNVRERLPDYQHRTLHIYDAVDYALNAFDVPVITYGGELDKQLAASKLMQAAAQRQGVTIEGLVGPGMGHKFDDASFEAFMDFHTKHAEPGRPDVRDRKEIRFITWTPKYNTCEWATIAEMARIYEPATLESRVADDGTLDLKTSNVDALWVDRDVAEKLTIDNDGPFPLSAAADPQQPRACFTRHEGRWQLLDARASRTFADNPHRRKRRDLQGPIDDAFMQPFVCVRGTGSPWSAQHQQWADWTLARFEREFDKWMRGRVPVVDDTAVTEELIADRNLILFGDPGSNTVIQRVLADLPVDWTEEALAVAGRTYDPDTHGLALIYPNPLNPRRYVVLNSGMTMHEKDFEASNAWLFPKLGDAAILNFTATPAGTFTESTTWAALFDTHWKLP